MDRLSSAIELDPVLHQPVRTRIAAYLAARGETSFTELKRALDITDGNLEAHMRKFVVAKYVKVRRDSSKGRPQSTYTLTAAGYSVFHEYVDCLQRLLFLES